MDNDSHYLIITAALIFLFVLSAFFAVCETAFTSANRIKLKNFAAKSRNEKSSRRAKLGRKAELVLKMLDSYDSLLSSVLFGNTIVNVASSALATVLFVDLFGPKGVTIATLTMTLLILIFGEISPKTLAKESPERGALRCAPLMRFFIFLFKPFSYFAIAWKKIILKLFPVMENRSITEDELLTYVEEVRQEGGINLQEEKMIRQAIEFDDITAAGICTHRIDVAAICENSTIEEIDRMFAETGYSRLPVYRESIDNITGVILLKDFHHEVINKGRPPGEIIKPVVFAAKTIKISSLLRTLQKKQSHMAVLVDEFGGTLGIVTVEDIIEELVGEIWDEHDDIIEEFKQNPDGSFSISGISQFSDMLEFINTRTDGVSNYSSRDDDIPDTTVGNWVMENTGGLPRPGDYFTWRSLKVTVSKVQRNRVTEVVVTINN